MDNETTITPEMLAAARAQFADLLLECVHCSGWSKPDPRRSPTRFDPVICLAEPCDAWFVRCFSCFACVTSTESAAEAVERWNRRAGPATRQPELLPLVDLQSLAQKCGVELTPAQELFARQLQADVLRLNRRPLQ